MFNPKTDQEARLADALADANDRIASLESELKEQAMLVGKGSEREAALLAKVERLERALAGIQERAAAMRGKADAGQPRKGATNACAWIDDEARALLSPDHQQSINHEQSDREGKG